MRTIYRYRTSKPPTGHFSFEIHREGVPLDFAENWHAEKGWELVIDFLVDTSKPVERRYFFLCNGGDDLSFLGEYPEAHYIGSHQSKSYLSYLFETTHLSETERIKGQVERARYDRRPATRDELSAPQKQWRPRPKGKVA